ncbi:MAG: transporter, partial [Limisphaerales bacterium]
MNDNMAVMGLPGLVPFGIMTGEAGRWMVGYQFMFDDMNGSLVGTQEISDSQILKEFPAVPTDMSMQMHMAMLMYAPTDKVTFSAMVPYICKEMNNITVTGERFVERADGIGDVGLRGSYCVFDSKDSRHRLLLNGGVGLPSGSIDATMDGMHLEYCMQIGSGTFSLLPGVTYLSQAAPWGWGADFNTILRLGRNGNGYRLGNACTG